MMLPNRLEGGTLTVGLAGRIDATNAPDVEQDILYLLDHHAVERLVLDCDQLTYLSSAGIRIMLRVGKRVSALSLTNVAFSVYEMLDMTGLTEIIEISRALPRVSVEGHPIIGEGAKGVLYRIGPETICKVYRDADALPEIERERQLARAAFVAGIPTAISYSVVRVGDGYGSVFELLDTSSLCDLLVSGEWSIERAAKESAHLLRQMATTEVDPEIMPSALDKAHEWVDNATGVLPASTVARLRTLVDALADEPHMVHGDFHIKNVMVQNGEPLLIDMETLSHGNSIFDLTTAYSAYVGRGITDPQVVERFLGLPYEATCRLWDLILRNYLPSATEQELHAAEDKIRTMSALRLISWPVRHHQEHSESGQRLIAAQQAVLDEVLPRVSSLAL